MLATILENHKNVIHFANMFESSNGHLHLASDLWSTITADIIHRELELKLDEMFAPIQVLDELPNLQILLTETLPSNCYMIFFVGQAPVRALTGSRSFSGAYQ